MRRRPSFTLVEMLVTMALIIFIMVIISEAFATGLGTFRQLKAMGDLQEKLRSAAIVMRRDLGFNHFEGSRKLSDPDFGPPDSSAAPVYIAPTQGFFRIEQTTDINSAREGYDAALIPSFRATNHILYFTIAQLPGNQRREDYLTGVLPTGSPLLNLSPRDYSLNSGMYLSKWAEVAYFLRANGGQTTPKDPGIPQQPLFTLYRRQCVLMPLGTDNTTANGRRLATSLIGDYHDMSVSPAPPIRPNGPYALHFNTPQDVTNPALRCLTLGGTPISWNATTLPAGASAVQYPILGERLDTQFQGDDLLISDVVSFTVRVLKAGDYDFSDLPAYPPTAPLPSYVYDTAFIGNNTTGPAPANNPFRIVAIEISLRVWDFKTLQTRQTTLVQNL